MKLHKLKLSYFDRQERNFGRMLNEIITAYNSALKATDKDAALAQVRQGIVDGSAYIWAEKQVQGKE